jgi:hypothetical protein
LPLKLGAPLGCRAPEGLVLRACPAQTAKSNEGPLPPKLSAPRLAWSWELARSRRPGRGRREAQHSIAAQLPAAGGSTPGDPPTWTPPEKKASDDEDHE